jgi:hypothetical protein
MGTKHAALPVEQMAIPKLQNNLDNIFSLALLVDIISVDTLTMIITLNTTSSFIRLLISGYMVCHVIFISINFFTHSSPSLLKIL